jgi:hypothetical protein
MIRNFREKRLGEDFNLSLSNEYWGISLWNLSLEGKPEPLSDTVPGQPGLASVPVFHWQTGPGPGRLRVRTPGLFLRLSLSDACHSVPACHSDSPAD